MDDAVKIIPFASLALAFLPVLFIIGILYRWPLDYRTSIHAVSRMLVQLALIGYLLPFESERASILLAVLPTR